MIFIVLLLVTACTDDMNNSEIRTSREAIIGFYFPSLTKWINSRYKHGLDDVWYCKFTLHKNDLDVMFSSNEVTWSTTENALDGYPCPDRWFLPVSRLKKL
jgi:hypothetical protein